MADTTAALQGVVESGSGELRRAPRPSRGGQDRHLERQPLGLVRRVHPAAGHRRWRCTTSEEDGTPSTIPAVRRPPRDHRRLVPGADLDDVHVGRARGRRGAGLPRAGRRRRAAVAVADLDHHRARRDAPHPTAPPDHDRAADDPSRRPTPRPLPLPTLPLPTDPPTTEPTARRTVAAAAAGGGGDGGGAPTRWLTRPRRSRSPTREDPLVAAVSEAAGGVRGRRAGRPERTRLPWGAGARSACCRSWPARRCCSRCCCASTAAPRCGPRPTSSPTPATPTSRRCTGPRAWSTAPCPTSTPSAASTSRSRWAPGSGCGCCRCWPPAVRRSCAGCSTSPPC